MAAEVPETGFSLRGCPHCGLVHRVGAVAGGHAATCTRCGDVIVRPDARTANRLCAAVSLAALICYPLGVTLPVMRLEQLGLVHETSIWAGTVSLLTHGQWLVGLVVLACSVVIPVLKLLGLFALTIRPEVMHRHNRARLYRAIEVAGRWGMIDVLLVAVLVAALKLGDVVAVTPGPGVAAFAACVLLSLIASAVFNPHAIWESPT